MVDLACVVAHRPSVVLLDEPSSGIAQRESEALGPLLIRIRDLLGAGLVVIEHDMPLLAGLADRMVALDQGSLLVEGSPDAVLHDPLVIASYLGENAMAIARSGAVRARGPLPRSERRWRPAGTPPGGYSSADARGGIRCRRFRSPLAEARGEAGQPAVHRRGRPGRHRRHDGGRHPPGRGQRGLDQDAAAAPAAASCAGRGAVLLAGQEGGQGRLDQLGQSLQRGRPAS